MARTSPSRRAAELAGELRTAINRLAFHLRTPAVRHGITPTRLSAMAALEKTGPQRPSDLAASLGISAASMSRLTEVLESTGWVGRSRDPEDHRACLLRITDDGRSTLDGLRYESTSRLTDGIAALSAEQRETLAAALPVLVLLADQHLDGVGGADGADGDGTETGEGVLSANE